MSFPRYPAYKDSGVEWLGEVPAHWAMRPLLAVAGECSEPNLGMKESNLLSLSYGRIITKDINSNDGLLPESFETYQIVRKDDLVLRLTDLQNDQRSLRSAVVEEAGIITSAYLAVRPAHVVPRFLHYLMRSYDLTKVFYSMGGGLRQSMKFADLKRLPILLPGHTEQLEIAAFLDRETAKIDALVAEQEKLIALLQEKRQAVISHAVTKGLDPNVPMKDSGVEWLGAVPAHWEVTRIKHLARSIEQGWSPQCEGYAVESPEEWGVLKVGCVNGGTFNPTENKALPPDLNAPADLGVRAGDLLVSRANTRELVGSAAVVRQDHPNLLLCDKLYRIRLDETRCIPGFLSLLLATRTARGQIELGASGASSSMLNIGQSTIMDMAVAVPPLPEQVAIEASVLCATDEIQSLSAAAAYASDLLKERRAALISAAVTGQIDVRSAVAETA